jgi:hypothetical protein
MTGFNLPPGCTSRMIDEALGLDTPCEVCGGLPEVDCICPECPECGAWGDPACYGGAIRCAWCGVKPAASRATCLTCNGGYVAASRRTFAIVESHGLVRSPEQIAQLADRQRQWREAAEAEAKYEAERSL